MDLRKGMFVIDRGLRGFDADPRVYSVEGFILSDDEGSKLRSQGYTSAFIDEKYSPELKKEYDVNDKDSDYISPNPEYHEPLVLMPSEIEYAIKARNNILEYARDFAKISTSGIQPPISEINKHLDPLLESLERNANALLSLTLLYAKDDYTFAHGVDVAIFASILGRQLGVDPQFVKELGLAGFLHDIGKLFVPQKILHHPGRINDSQFHSMQRHAEQGYKHLSRQNDISDFILGGVLDHHERYDGQGYPNRKKGKEISLAGRIIAVVDVYDALTSQRRYRKPLTHRQALKELYSTRENDFSPGYLEAFIAAIGVFPPGSFVELSDGSHAVVTESTDDKLRPKVVVVTDEFGRQIRPRYFELSKEDRFVNRLLENLTFKINVLETIMSAT